MKSIQLLSNLMPFQKLCADLKHEFFKESSSINYNLYVRSQYNFITIELKRKANDIADKYEQLVMKIQFLIEGDKIVLSDVYAEEMSVLGKVKQYISHVLENELIWNSNKILMQYFEATTINYLRIADSIAEVGSKCSSGDNYSPSYYSESILTDKLIQLNQSNWHNAKSSSHKKDYYMRDLKIRIPLIKEQLKIMMGDHQIGEMLLSFEDRSSPNNKSCGDAILVKLLEEKELFLTNK